MLKYSFLSVIFILSVFKMNSQVSIGGGINTVAAFGVKNPYVGFNLLGEYREDDLSYFVKYYNTFKQNHTAVAISMISLDQNDSISLNLNGNLTYGYSVFEFGKRQYFAKDFDFGPAVFYSSHFALMMNPVGVITDKFDEKRYKFPDDYTNKGKLFALAIGLNAGTQYSFYYGTYYLDIGFNYILNTLPNNYLASNINPNQLFFAFNLGFKKNIFTNF